MKTSASTDTDQRMVQLQDFQALWDQIKKDVLSSIDRVGQRGQWILGPEVSTFETALAQRWGLQEAIGCASGLDAIEIGLRCLGLRAGTKVLTTPLSAFATTLAILRAGGVPVFVDTDSSGLLNLDLCEKVFQEHSDIRFFVPVHLYGHPLDLDRLAGLRDKYKLRIVEDCAQAIDASWEKHAVGSIGQLAATSFYPTKNLGGLGDGGALLTSDPDMARQARKLRDYGQSDKYKHTELGLNSRLDEIQAAILMDAMLPHLTDWTERRRAIAARYISGIRHAKLSLVSSSAGGRSAWHLFPILVEDHREDFQAYLRQVGIGSAVHYPTLITDQPALSESSKPIILSALHQAERLSRMEVSLPLHPFLNDADVEKVISACNRWNP